MQHEILDTILAARGDKRPLAVVTNLVSGAQSLVIDGKTSGQLDLNGDVAAAVLRAVVDDRSGRIAECKAPLFVHVFNPPKRLILVGAVHISQPLVPMATLAGYRVTVIDPRGAFATTERFPGVELRNDWPDEAMSKLKPDRRTAVVTLTHDPKLDDPALTVALRSDAFYIGSLGSKKTHSLRLQRLREAGFDETDLARIHGPVGLAIGATSPSEIAVAIMAQITQALHESVPRADAA